MSNTNSPIPTPEAIIAITEEVLGRRLAPGTESASMSFAALGVDSVNVFEIILKIEAQFGVSLSDTFIFDYRTPLQAAEALRQMMITGETGSGFQN